MQFLLNLSMDDLAIDDKEIYTYDDILKLDLDNKPLLVNTPIGQTFMAINSDLTYTVNPFDVDQYDPFLERYAEEITATTNQTILMNALPIYNNMLYICRAENVLNYAIQNNLSEESTIKIYFPNLFKKEIVSESILDQNKQQLLLETDLMLNKVFERNKNNVNLFYSIFYQRNSQLPYTEKGIKEIEFIIHPNYSFNLPLDVVFKLIHATKVVPFIKFNPMKRLEKIYRLYADKVATNGKKIPYLNKSTILKLIKTVALDKSVGVYIEHYFENEEEHTPVFCEFGSNGDITVKAIFLKSLPIETINKELALAVNPVINVVKDYLSQSGYSMNIFKDLFTTNIEILNIDYVLHIPIKIQLKLKELTGCLSSVFNILNDDINTGASMRFKRVANYNEMDSQEAFIIDLYKSHHTLNEIVKELAANFQLSEEAAQNKIKSFADTILQL